MGEPRGSLTSIIVLFNVRLYDIRYPSPFSSRLVPMWGLITAITGKVKGNWLTECPYPLKVLFAETTDAAHCQGHRGQPVQIPWIEILYFHFSPLIYVGPHLPARHGKKADPFHSQPITHNA